MTRTLASPFSQKNSESATTLLAFKGIAVLRLHRAGYITAQSDRIDRRALREALQYRHLRGEHVSFMKNGNCAFGFVLYALGSVGDEDSRRVNHRLCRCLAFTVGGLLRA